MHNKSFHAVKLDVFHFTCLFVGVSIHLPWGLFAPDLLHYFCFHPHNNSVIWKLLWVRIKEKNYINQVYRQFCSTVGENLDSSPLQLLLNEIVDRDKYRFQRTILWGHTATYNRRTSCIFLLFLPALTITKHCVKLNRGQSSFIENASFESHYCQAPMNI